MVDAVNAMLYQYASDNIVFKKLNTIATYKDGAAHEHILSDVGKYTVAKVKFISTNGEFRKYADVRLTPVEKDDVIMVMSDLPNGKSLAKCYLIEQSNTYTINQRVCALTANKNFIIPKFLFYVLNRNPQLLCYDNGYSQTHLKKKWILDVDIPLPPIEVQYRIVETLDSFNTLIATLKEHLGLCERQVAWCNQKLFAFDNNTGKYTLDELCVLEKGKTAIQKATPGNYPLVVTALARKSSDTYQFNSAAVCIPLVSSRGHGVASMNQVFYQEGEFALGNILCAATPKNENVLSAKYLYYYLNDKKDVLLVPLMKGGANVSLTVNTLRGVKIPLPSRDRQEQIVERLDVLEDYCKAYRLEIEERQMQYEYYRDKLLSFEEKVF